MLRHYALAAPMPNATFSHEAATSRSVDEVWERLQQVETWAGIGPVEEVWDPVHDEAGDLVSYRWSAHVGPTRYRGTAEVIEAERDRLMRLDLDGGEVAGTLTTKMDRNGDGTRLVVTLRIVSRGTLSALFFPLVADAVGRVLPEQVQRFVARIDEGE